MDAHSSSAVCTPTRYGGLPVATIGDLDLHAEYLAEQASI